MIRVANGSGPELNCRPNGQENESLIATSAEQRAEAGEPPGDAGNATPLVAREDVSERLRETIDALLVLMPLLTRRVSEMATACKQGERYNPTLPQIRVMTVVSTRGKATVSAIADALELSRPATSELVDRMVESGFVTRGVNPADRRQVLISLTPPAARIVDEIVGQRRALLLDALADLSDEELAGFLKGMRGFTRNLAPEMMSDPALAFVCQLQDDSG
jgi:DNA-binding MarR family transcriptional regulator